MTGFADVPLSKQPMTDNGRPLNRRQPNGRNKRRGDAAGDMCVRLGMMQPYFFPYLGYFALIAATDEWVVFDTAQYVRRSWMNRNRVHSSGPSGWKYVRLPVAAADRTTPIRQMSIARPNQVKDDILRRLDEYRLARAPHYEATMTFLDACLSQISDSLLDSLMICLQATCRHIGLSWHPQLFSGLPVAAATGTKRAPGDWALLTAIHLGATAYINPPGGRRLFDPAAFRRHGIRLLFLEHRLPPYGPIDRFLPGLSIIDALMWQGAKRVRQLIDDYRLTDASGNTVASSPTAVDSPRIAS